MLDVLIEPILFRVTALILNTFQAQDISFFFLDNVTK